MITVEIAIRNKTYHLFCEEGEDAYLYTLAAELDRRARDVQGSETSMFLILALQALDEMHSLKASASETHKQAISVLHSVATALEKLAYKVETG